MSRDYTRAAKAFQAFTGRQAKGVQRAVIQDSAVGWKLGPAVGVAYEATRDGEKARYFHEFAKVDRPDLVVSEDGRQLYFAGGKYRVTDRGIEDMSEMFIVNPSPRRGGRKGKRTMAKTARNARGRFVKRGASGGRKRRRTGTQVAVFRQNPVRRRRRPAAKRTVRRYRRNPSGGMSANFGKMLVPAMGIGGGAVLSEVIMGYMPIPANLKTGVMRHVTKGGVGVALGWALSKFLRQKRLGTFVMLGAVAIATHDALKEAIASRMPAIQMAQYVRPLPSQFRRVGLAGRGMGYVNPATTVQLNEYVSPLPNQFGGASQAYRDPGGEVETFQA